MDAETQIKHDLRAAYDLFEECVNTKTIGPLATKFYTPDALFMTNGPPSAHGLGQLMPLLEHAANQVFLEVRIEMVETRIYDTGNTVCDLTLIRTKYRDGTSGTQRSCCIFKRTSDGWRCDVDIAVNP